MSIMNLCATNLHPRVSKTTVYTFKCLTLERFYWKWQTRPILSEKATFVVISSPKTFRVLASEEWTQFVFTFHLHYTHSYWNQVVLYLLPCDSVLKILTPSWDAHKRVLDFFNLCGVTGYAVLSPHTHFICRRLFFVTQMLWWQSNFLLFGLQLQTSLPPNRFKREKQLRKKPQRKRAVSLS